MQQLVAALMSYDAMGFYGQLRGNLHLKLYNINLFLIVPENKFCHIFEVSKRVRLPRNKILIILLQGS
jgi:hypothetical protein